MDKLKEELKKPEDYFPYIGHELDHNVVYRNKIYKNIVGNLLNKENISQISDDSVYINGSNSRSLFKEIKITGLARQLPVIQAKNAVGLYIPRHRSLFDYIVQMPIHYHFFTPNVMILAGNNLFVFNYDTFLRKCGAFMYLREDVFLKRKGLKRVFLSKDRYMDEVFPAYVRQQMFEGTDQDKSRKDLIIYPENEKNPVTRKRAGGRTKSGKLRTLSPVFFDKLKNISRDYPVKLYVNAMNISFSKIPEAPYIVHASKVKGLKKKLHYLLENYFTMLSYPRYALSHQDAKLEVSIHYGKPELLDAASFTSMRDLIGFTKSIEFKIGRLESIFPVTFLYRVLDNNQELSLADCEERMKTRFEYYSSIGVNIEKISDSKGNMLPPGEIIEKSMKTINSNPSFFVKGVRKNNFLKITSGRIVSYDRALQVWYANNIRHLDKNE
ncbi:MAG: hypothetical protein JXB88_18695 [Spirochaetales bacterium]|nr:hypothetical protein [Spirochaetales bacterium]